MRRERGVSWLDNLMVKGEEKLQDERKRKAIFKKYTVCNIQYVFSILLTKYDQHMNIEYIQVLVMMCKQKIRIRSNVN